MTNSSDVTKIEFYFDTMCPYAYQTSLWIRDVRRQNGIEIDWKFFSLEEINHEEGMKHPWERDIAYGWTPLRVAAYLRRTNMDNVDNWYAACGKALHYDGRRPYEPETGRELLKEIGLDPAIWDAALADPTTHDEVKADHDHAVNNLGAFGVPVIIAADTRAMFGPVVLPAPMGEEAMELWDITIRAAKFPGLYELKRPKTGVDLRYIGAVFSPYFNAREWQTVMNPAL